MNKFKFGYADGSDAVHEIDAADTAAAMTIHLGGGADAHEGVTCVMLDDEETVPGLRSCNGFPDTIRILSEDVLGTEIIARAFKQSELTVEAWNALEDYERSNRLHNVVIEIEKEKVAADNPLPAIPVPDVKPTTESVDGKQPLDVAASGENTNG